MNHSSPATRLTRFLCSDGSKWLSRILAVALLVGATSGRAQTQTPDDQYLHVLALVDRADTLNEKKQGDLGKAKYTEAARILQQFRLRYPTWQPKMVAFRLNYLTDKIAVLTQTNAPAISNAGAGTGAAVSGGAQVKLLEAGAEPRQVLRLQPKAGDKQSVSTTLKMEIEMMGSPMKLPSMKSPMDVTITTVAPNGDITYEIVTGEITATDEGDAASPVGAAFKDALGGTAGMKSTATMSNRGLGKSEFKAPADANPQTRQVVEQLADALEMAVVPLPEEAVGPGAKWESKQSMKNQGISLTQTTTYELVSVEGSVLKIKSKQVQTAPNQKIENPQAPGMKLDLSKFSGKGSADISLDLGKIIPTSAKTDMQSEVEMSMNLGGQKQAMAMKMTMQGEMESN
jgi:hypothetical protein